jgi:hypothetical protein
MEIKEANVNKFLVLLTLIGGVCSVLGFATPYVTSEQVLPRNVLVPVFLLTATLVVYVLLVPANVFVRNVREKVVRYRAPSKAACSEEIVNQLGGFKVVGSNTVSVVFDVPYAEVPEVQVVNVYGHAAPARVKSKTALSATFEGTAGNSWPYRFEWLASGRPLERVVSS